MNTVQLECFLEVANCLNFSRAAERLRITQPAVSHQIQTLENELGVPLFHRTSKSVRLTQEGFQFLDYAGEMLKLFHLSKARMKASQQNFSRRLVIGCRNTSELRFLAPALQQLRQQHPDALPVLRLIPFDSLENLLQDGDIDLMFSFQDPVVPKTRFHELALCQAVCACRPDHPLAKQSFVTTEQLRTAGRIAACRPPICPPALFSIQTQAMGTRSVGEILFCDNQEVQLTLVQTGYAFAVLADFPHARLPELCYLPLQDVAPLSFGACSLPENKNPLLQKFLALLAAAKTPPLALNPPAAKESQYF